MAAPLLTFRTPPERQAVPRSAPELRSFSELLLDRLFGLGVERAFGLVGGAIAPLAHALAIGPLATYHFRHEGGAGFAALEASLATDRPTVIFTTTGPGLTNALTPLWAARWEGAKVLLISGATNAAQRGRWACQETSSYTLPGGFTGPGPIFHFAATVESPAELDNVCSRLAAGFARPEGFVAHLQLPLTVQSAPLPATPRRALFPAQQPTLSPDGLAGIADALAHDDVVIWAGHGARHAAPELFDLATRLGAPVMCSPRGKGVFPERHPLYLGSTGLGGQGNIEAHFAARRPAHLLVLGTRLSEPTSFWNPLLLPREALFHVDLDPQVPGAAYPEARTVPVQAEVRTFLRGLLSALDERPRRSVAPPTPLPAPPLLRDLPDGEKIRPPRVIAEVQRVFLDGSDAVVMAESGNSFAWGNQLLRCSHPGQYRVSTGFGSMGHMTAGVVGAALARQGKAVAIIGDGSMLMQNEVSTAVQYRAKAVWLVMNDAQYGMVEQGMRALGFTPLETALPDTDFAAFARAQGALGLRVDHERELGSVFEQALAAEGPCVVDIRIDGKQTAPWMRRIQNLIAQGAEESKGATR